MTTVITDTAAKPFQPFAFALQWRQILITPHDNAPVQEYHLKINEPFGFVSACPLRTRVSPSINLRVQASINIMVCSATEPALAEALLQTYIPCSFAASISIRL